MIPEICPSPLKSIDLIPNLCIIRLAKILSLKQKSHRIWCYIPVNRWGNLTGKMTASLRASLAIYRPATSSHFTLGRSITMAPVSKVNSYDMSKLTTQTNKNSKDKSVIMTLLIIWLLSECSSEAIGLKIFYHIIWEMIYGWRECV